jgi:hypothetical protein
MAGAVGKRVVDAYNSPGLPILKAMAGIKEAPIEEKEAPTKGITWTKEAEEALKKNVPRLVRPMAKKAIEKHAKERGASKSLLI